MRRPGKIYKYIASFYTLDLRALAAMRIGLALVILADLLIRGSDLTAHYSATGLWPASLIHTFGWQPGYWSLHAWNDSYAWELCLFCLHGFFAVLLLIGFKTRFATLMVWLLYISLHNRNLFVLQSGDDLLRLTLLWGLFLPWQTRYSIDARQGTYTQYPIATAGYLLLLASVYFFTVSLKSSAEWHSEGSAIYYALSLEQLRLPGFGDWLYQQPGLMKWLTWVVFYSELLIPILILWPSSKGRLRGFAFILLLLLHVGIGLSLYVGLFFIICIVSALALLPGALFDKAESLLKFTLPASMPRTPHLSIRLITTVISSLLILLCLLINLGNVRWFPYQLDDKVQSAANALRLNQYWGMFSPSILKTDGWMVYHGADSIGRQWDLRLNQDYVDYHKPAHIVRLYKSDRWRKLAENMQMDDHAFLRPIYCKYILHSWNKHHAKKIAILNLYFMQKQSLPDYKTTAIEKKLFSVCTND